MSPDQFTQSAPGRLVRVAFDERISEGGQTKAGRVEGWAFVPDPLPPRIKLQDLPEQVVYEIIGAERSLARLDGIGEDLPNAHLLWGPLAKREAILSSAIEDTIASATELASVEAGERPERHEVREVMNYVDALRFGLASELPICLRLIRGLHEKLMAFGVRGSEWTPGEFRQTQNYIGRQGGFERARFVPPPPGDVLTGGLRDLERYANERSLGLPKLVAAALIHYQFETLHPFADGNGRIGRLLSALSLCRMGLLKQPFVYLSPFIEPRRSEYNDLMLRVSTRGEWLPWIGFFVSAVAHQAQDAEQRVRTLRQLRGTYRSRALQANAPARVFAIIDDLFESPMLTVESVSRKLAISRPTARTYIQRLEQMEIVTQIPSTYRGYWIATEIISFIDAPPERVS
jgi:Fic family protein